MRNQDRRAFTEALQAVYALHRAEFSTGVLEIWWRALAPYDLVAVQDALGRHAINPDTGQFLPKPADVIKQLEGGTLDAAIVAWAKVVEAIRRLGSYHSVAFDDPLIHACLDEMGGWMHICLVTDDDLPFREKEFHNRYRSYRSRHQLPAYPPYFPGYIELENKRTGYLNHVPPPTLIGAPEGARLVMSGGSAKTRTQMTIGAAAQTALLEHKDAA